MTDATNNTTAPVDEAKPAPKAKPKAKKPAPKAKAKKPSEPSVTSVLAKELGMAPKILRSKLRSKGFKAPYTNIDKLRAALKGDAK